MAYKQNDHDIAFKLLNNAIKAEPENISIPLTLIKLYLRENLHEKINDLYEQLPESIKQKEDFISLKTHDVNFKKSKSVWYPRF